MTELRFTGLGRGTIAWSELASLPGLVEDAGEVAGGAFGAAVPVASILDRSIVDSSATYCSVVSRDGEYSASIPMEELIEGGWLAFALHGEPLPESHGGPLRLTVSEGTTLCWNVKDVGELRFTAEEEPDSIPANPTH